MMNRTHLFVTACVVCLFIMFFAGCTFSGGGPCTADVEPGIVVGVFDAQTQAPLASRATATIHDGSYTETLRPYGFADNAGTLVSLSGAYERAGNYTVDVTVPGYTPFEMKNVRVTKGACHVKGVGLEADLQPVK